MRELSFLNKGLKITLNDERVSSKDEEGVSPSDIFILSEVCQSLLSF